VPVPPPFTPEDGKPHALKSAVTSLQSADSVVNVVPVLPPDPEPMLQVHVAPASSLEVQFTSYSVPPTVSVHPHCVKVAPSSPPPPPPKQLAGATPASLGPPGGGGGTPCEKHAMVPSGPSVQQRSGSPCGVCHPGGHASQLGVGGGGGGGQLQGGHGGHEPSASHAGQAQVQPPPVLPPDPMQNPEPSDEAWQHVTPPEPPPLLLLPDESGGEYHPTGHG